MSIIVYIDGLIEPVNPGGIATYGFVVYRGGVRIYEETGLVGSGMDGDDVSNNVAEYTGLIKALEWLVKNNLTVNVTVKCDSQLVVMQMNNLYRVHASRILNLHRKAIELTKMFKEIKFIWIPRSENIEADSLSRKAYLDFIKKNWSRVRKYYADYKRLKVNS